MEPRRAGGSAARLCEVRPAQGPENGKDVSWPAWLVVPGSLGSHAPGRAGPEAGFRATAAGNGEPVMRAPDGRFGIIPARGLVLTPAPAREAGDSSNSRKALPRAPSPAERPAGGRSQVRLPGVDDSRDLRERAGAPVFRPSRWSWYADGLSPTSLSRKRLESLPGRWPAWRHRFPGTPLIGTNQAHRPNARRCAKWQR
jgi:hypothetical protein